ncbi:MULTISPECIES: hypothetical protein [Sulfitobacter]|uniref:hypothetical protein n=1 Tax=Sulfitobacter TaxID=60136 RepID=UPI00104D90FD|nr:hypothetical protein [Sulfitobacter indolifex]
MPASYFYSKLGDEADLQYILPALNLLTTIEHALLKAHGYLQFSNEDPRPLDDEDFHELLVTGELVDDESGELIENPWTKVHLYYSARENAFV